ncbi:hypothetical protein BC629DRAFT_901123 [Irpex lacteus]|nr:hypothetical protein BC629DRAFT_901123 [Irpex lacteus]
MGQKHIQFYCSICYGWVSKDIIRLLPCGHAYCVECISNMTRHRRCTCPECRTRFTAKDLPQIYCDVRDKRTRQLLAATRSDEAPTIDLTDPPSSSRAGTPTQDVDEDDEESGSGGGYPLYVQNHAARCVDLVESWIRKLWMCR